MFYATAPEGWSPGHPLPPTPARAGLFPTRSAVGDRATLAVALRYDPARGLVVAQGAAARGPDGPWSAPAVVDAWGGVSALAPIPPSLLRVLGAPELRAHPRVRSSPPRPFLTSWAGRRPGSDRDQAPTLFRLRPERQSPRPPPAAA